MPAYITGLGVFLPNKPVPNEKVEAILGMVGSAPSPVRDVILDRNGIKWRYYAIDPHTGQATHSNAQLTAGAVRKLAEGVGLDLREIRLLVCGTSSPDQAIPNHAAMVHGLLGCPSCEIVSTAGVCCSGMTAMKYGYAAVLAGLAPSAVVTGSELASAALRASQFYTASDKVAADPAPANPAGAEGPYLGFNQEFLRFMLSDGAGAVLIEPWPRSSGPALRIEWIDIHSLANELPACMYSGAIKLPDGALRGWREEPDGVEGAFRKGYLNLSQDVGLLGENIVKAAGRSFRKTCEDRELRHEHVDWFLPHLSSMFFHQPLFDEMVANGFPVPLEKWFTNLKYKGNTGAASIFIMLEELTRSGKLQKGQRILCAVPESARFTFAYMYLTVV
jgi:3-oxoacyl-[acyl-carrier-protein] synthase-3